MEASPPHALDLQRMLRWVDEDFVQTAGLTGVARMSDRVRAAFAAVPRHRFVPDELALDAYDDRPLPIGHGQTISQPFIVALMTELLAPRADDTVLEVGTGCGYQTAVLAALARQVHSIEIVAALSRDARERLADLGIRNVALHVGDGHRGFAPAAPFDGIVVTAAPHEVPAALLDQLRPGGRMVLPIGSQSGAQELCVLDKRDDGSHTLRRALDVRFVPMTGAD